MAKTFPGNQMQAMAMAMAGAAVAAIATMFVPAPVLEGLAGPIATPPLGDAARALFAFGAGAFMLAVLTFVLLRRQQPAKVPGPAVVDMADMADMADAADAEEADSSFGDRLARIKLPQMPWVKDESDITELSDLPKLKTGDAHPDAPPRRPLRALELATVEAVDIAQTEPEAELAAEAAPEIQQPVDHPADEAAPVLQAVTPVRAKDMAPTLAEMVAQLEAAVSERKKQLAELEIVAAQLGAGGTSAQPDVKPAMTGMPRVEPPARIERPALEAVPQAPVEGEEMDSALSAALATLHRMNGTAR